MPVRAYREDASFCPPSETPTGCALEMGREIPGGVLRIENPAKAKSAWVQASAWPVLKADGSVEYVVTAVTNITEQKRTEAELRAAQGLVEQAQKAAHLGYFNWDIASKKMDWSTLEVLYGLRPGEFSGDMEDWERTVLPEDLPSARLSLEHGFQTGETAAEFRIRRQNDGEVRWIEARGSVFFDDNGAPVRMLGFNVDITERKRAEESLAYQSRLTDALFGQATICFALFDRRCRFIRVNEAWSKYHGIEPGDFVGRGAVGFF
jgi:PAS domain S-box-containing protein